jgi:2-methylcitrate dehydratase PrpD
MSAVPSAPAFAPEGATTLGETRALARFVANLRPEDVPARVVDVLSSALVDGVGCGLYGMTTQWAQIVQGFAEEQGGPLEASFWAAGRKKGSAANVVLAAGTAIHSFDFDDHNRAKIHPGAVVIPTVLALGERQGISGARALAAMAAGYEVMTRVSLAANPGPARMRGWHLTGTCGTFGAAAAASVVLGLDAETTASALGLAGTQSAGLWAFNVDGAMSKRLHPGRAAQSGVIAALLGARGFQGPRHILEAADGGFLRAMSDEPRFAEATCELGDAWRTEGVCFKPYACCGSNHACVDAALQIMREQSLAVADIARVIAGISKVVETQTGFEYQPSTVLNAQMSLRYNVAVALIDGRAYLEQFTPSRISAPDVCELAARVAVEIDPEMDRVYPGLYAGIVHIETKDGRRFTRRVDHSKGMPENPMSAHEIDEKFLSLAASAVGRARAGVLLQKVRHAFSSLNIAAVSKAIGESNVVAATQMNQPAPELEP